ncbi:hypothetical protein [Bacillus alveayuensis]|uniref:hypothetical protein n=1 Tax=Aeribacillus alveayuensis TaxID=279215 RepID=UPI0005CD8276|nr:hypothetical protein [Bacillus alveayuensis]
MKKQICWLMMLSLLLTLFFYNKWYYPPLPEQLSGVSKREVLNRIQHLEEPLVKIEENEDYEFYISHMRQGRAYDVLKEHMKEKGNAFYSQEGSGYFFIKINKDSSLLHKCGQGSM